MDKNKPLIIWIIKHKPNNDPKFHQMKIFIGVASLITALLNIFKMVLVFIIDLFTIHINN